MIRMISKLSLRGVAACAVLLFALGTASADPIPLAQLTTANVREHMKGYLETPEAKTAIPAGLIVSTDGLSYENKLLVWTYKPVSKEIDALFLPTTTKLLKQGFGNYKGGLLESKDLEAVMSTYTVKSTATGSTTTPMPMQTPKEGDKPSPTTDPIPEIQPQPILPYTESAPAVSSGSCDCGISSYSSYSSYAPAPVTTCAVCYAAPVTVSSHSGCRIFGFLHRGRNRSTCTIPAQVTQMAVTSSYVPSAPVMSTCGGCSAANVPVYTDTVMASVVAAPSPTLSQARLDELKKASADELLGEVSALYSQQRPAAANQVAELLLDNDSRNPLAWCWKAVLERRLGRTADASVAAERVQACLMVRDEAFVELASGLEKVQGDDRIFLRTAPAPTSLAMAKAIVERPWRTAADTTLAAGR